MATRALERGVETKECVICAETIPAYDNFPKFSKCSHAPEACSSCIAKHTVTKIEHFRGSGWLVCTCPQCNDPVDPTELQDILSPEKVKEIQRIIDRARSAAEQTWRWCLARGCGDGSHYYGRHEMIQCRKCQHEMCFQHQVPWHTGYTCEEYELSHPQAKINKVNEEKVKQISKRCPTCGVPVEKVGGCDDIICEQGSPQAFSGLILTPCRYLW